MSTSTESLAPQRANGLLTYLSVITTPRVAFETLSRMPMWGWAAIAGIVITLVATFIGLPATLHIAALAQQKAISEMPADQQAQATQTISQFAGFTRVAIIMSGFFVPWIGWLIYAVVMLIAAALGGGAARFKNAWVAAVNVYLIPAITQLVQSIILRMRPIESLSSQSDFYVVPSLAFLAHGNVKLAAFLYGYNVLYVWTYIVAVIALEQVMKVSRTTAIVAVIILSLIGSALGMLGAK